MIDQTALQNRLLSRLDPDDFALLADELEFCQLSLGTVLWDVGETIESAYFFEDGVASIVAKSPRGQVAEAGIIGREGFVYPSIILGSDIAPLKIELQIDGSAYRVPAPVLARAAEQSPTMRRLLLRFAHVNTVQASYSILSNAVNSVEERLARWLLMCHDRSPSDDLALTHGFVGMMLSVRRPSVTDALHVLTGLKLIETSRGSITVTNRARLERFAGEAYGKPEAEYRRLLGPL